MKSEQRRKEIISRLAASENPVSASVLAEEFGVSRQIIVKDIAKIRTEGTSVLSHPRGYTLENRNKFEKVFKMFHSDEDVEKELNLIVDLGGTVLDVFIYHKVYNKVRATMNIKTRLDVENFLENIKTGKSSLLKNVTSGYHYHTISADNPGTLVIIEEKLKEAGFLAPLQEYEPSEIENQ